MKYLNITAIIVTATLAAIPAFARYPAPPMGYGYPSAPQNSIYISGNLGSSILATPDQNLQDPDGYYITGASHSNGSIAGGGSIGLRRAINPFFAVGAEFGYDYNGRATYDETYGGTYYYADTMSYKITSQDFHLLATGEVLFRSGFNIFGKAGVARVDQSLKITNDVPGQDIPYLISDSSVNGYKPMAAAGIGYRFRMVDIYAQYAHIFGTNATTLDEMVDSNGNMNIVSVDTFKLGLAVNLRI